MHVQNISNYEAHAVFLKLCKLQIACKIKGIAAKAKYKWQFLRSSLMSEHLKRVYVLLKSFFILVMITYYSRYVVKT